MSNCLHFDANTTSDPLDIFFECSIEELTMLESVGANDLSELVDDNLNDDEELSIDPDDLKEWLCETPYEDYRSYEDSMNIDLEPNAITIPTCSNVQGMQIDDSMNVYSSISDQQLPNRMNITSQSLESVDSQMDSDVSIQRHMAGQHLVPQQKSNPAYSLPMHPSTVKNLNDLISGRRNCLTSELEESRKLYKILRNSHESALAGKDLVTKLQESEKRLKMLKSQSSVLKYNKFFTGEQMSLTPEVENSRHRLKILIDSDTPPACIVNHRAACA